jgi:hypothetical protein
MSPTKIDACWVQKGLLLEPKPSDGQARDVPRADDYSINACSDDILFRRPIYLTVEIKGAASSVDPLVQLARWNIWSRLIEVRNGVQGDHFVLPAISVEDHVWKLYFHSYDADARQLVKSAPLEAKIII